MRTGAIVAVDILWVVFATVVAYFSIHFDARLTGEIDSTDVVRTMLCIIFLAIAVGFGKQTGVDFAKLLRESAHGS